MRAGPRRVWVLAPLACPLLVLASACAALQYRLAGADDALRQDLDRGLVQLSAEKYEAARTSLGRAVWELEQIENSWLRLKELAEAHQALADVYSALRRPEWADGQRELATALGRQANSSTTSEGPERTLTRGKAAYMAAQFHSAGAELRAALVDLESLTHAPVRIRSLEEARCYLAFTYFALDQRDRAKEEIRVLRALDPNVEFCHQVAPPSIRRVIVEVLEEQRDQ